MSDIISTCRVAWDSTKREHQPDYDGLIESYRAMLTARAEGVLATGMISEDAPFHPFENGVLSQSKTAIKEIEDITPHKIGEPIHLESQGYAEFVPDEPSGLEATGTITVDPEEKSVTVNIKRVVKKPAPKKAVKVVKKVAKKGKK